MSLPIHRKARVILVDDSADILDLYRRFINKQPDMECVRGLVSTVGLEEAIAETEADVAIIDLSGPGRDALEAIRTSAPAFPACRMIVFSGHDDPATREKAASAGAWSLVSKHDAPEKLLEEIRRAVRGTN